MAKEKLKTIDIKGKKYVTVNERIRYFSEAYPNGMITTAIIRDENGVVLMQAQVIPDMEKPQRFFTGYAQEKESGSFINKTSHIENCETSAIGRALGIMGIGVEDSVASAEEVLNAITQQNNKPISAPKPKIAPPATPKTTKSEAEPGQKQEFPAQPTSATSSKPKSKLEAITEQLESWRKKLGDNAFYDHLIATGMKEEDLKNPNKALGFLEYLGGLEK